ncbi:MAG: hypothetical protein ACR2RB_11935 [Gammaproteobacteria bacterium]
MVARQQGVIANANVREFFHESIGAAMTNQGIEADDHTVYYVVNLLTGFTRADYQRGWHRRPLAFLLKQAIECDSTGESNQALKRLGDVALFVSGFFANSLNRKLVDVDYYIAMGGNAYGSLSERVRGTSRGQVFSDIFSELAAKFQDFVDVLGEVSEQACSESDRDILRLYERWRRTGSKRAERQLRELGIHTMSTGQLAH